MNNLSSRGDLYQQYKQQDKYCLYDRKMQRAFTVGYKHSLQEYYLKSMTCGAYVSQGEIWSAYPNKNRFSRGTDRYIEIRIDDNALSPSHIGLISSGYLPQIDEQIIVPEPIQLKQKSDYAQYWTEKKKKFREIWNRLTPDMRLAKIYLSIIHGAVELEWKGKPYTDKKIMIGAALTKIGNFIINYIPIAKEDIIRLEQELILAGFKMLESRGYLTDINAYFGFIDEINKEDGIVKVLLNINGSERSLDFPIENVPSYLYYEGAGVCWVERIYSDVKIGRFEPGGALTGPL